ncbi:putative ABC transport system ATP-binding protein [Clostridium cavendishii DSM 21758]|uniref:Putative ABC transport system ATP-binding protein n=1 Tax=Clostridium cavendishii DSM 21758 TaxID=1121302 RepID=A0A1M6F0H4_9CLOT|nr:ABC transporter ATP-binding protein [Clostridium cavendishii]SHI91129.1 putative ABC transport system ATP-binding protein [Clostridium cavendishii DSM 21758]
MNESKEIIKINGVSKIYNTGATKFKALDNINLTINKGEYVAIVGPSGAGKSTLMNIIGCLDTPTEGEYILDSVNTKCSDSKLASIRNSKIGFIFQSYNLLPKISILDNVELPLHYLGVSNKEARERAEKALDKMGLSKHVKHKPTELSGGQMQRVAIARALVSTPQIILADEPTGALDSKTGKEVMEILKSLNDEGNTIVMITHDRDLAKRAKRIVTVMDGIITSDEYNEQVQEVSL